MNNKNEPIQLEDSIIIFEKPNLYFFNLLTPQVYPPYSARYESFSYYLYRVFLILHIPLYTLYWKNWSRRLSDAKQVIIFDYGYQRGMEKYIKKRNPDCKISLFIWNIVDENHHFKDDFSLKDRMFSTDLNDCKKYNFKHNTMFYLNSLYRKSTYNMKLENKEKFRLFFIGTDKNRGRYLCQLKNIFSESGIECDIRLLAEQTDPEYCTFLKDILTSEYLPYDKYLEEIRKSDIVLDIVQDAQEALTMRVVESIFMNKKLITNNRSVRNLNFYNRNNIFILDESNCLPEMTELKEFIHLPFIEYPDEVREYYDITSWLNRF